MIGSELVFDSSECPRVSGTAGFLTDFKGSTKVDCYTIIRHNEDIQAQDTEQNKDETVTIIM